MQRGRSPLTRLGVALAACAAGCTAGAPPGFSGGASGDRWALPLVGPLENGLLITAVQINTHGPYLFAIDPDAPISIVDGDVVKEAGLRTSNGPHRLDETDTQQPRPYAEIIGLEIGQLIIERRDVIVVRPGSFDVAGRRISGVIGRDVIADSLVFGIDRDRGVVHLMTQKSFQPPPGATALGYEELASRFENAQTSAAPRRLVDATVNGAKHTLHVDFGAPASQLRESLWEKTKLVPREVQTAVIDEVGVPRRITTATEPTQVTVGPITSDGIVFIPYGDRRWDEMAIDGALGLGFFAPHVVWASWHTRQLYLSPRREVDAAERIRRWDSAVFSRCEHLGCISMRLVDPLAGKPLDPGRAHPGIVLSITRDGVAGGMPLEVMLEATGRPELPRLLVNMPAHIDRMIHQLPGVFAGVTVTAVDASPYPRKCPGPNGCVDQLAR